MKILRVSTCKYTFKWFLSSFNVRSTTTTPPPSPLWFLTQTQSISKKQKSKVIQWQLSPFKNGLLKGFLIGLWIYFEQVTCTMIIYFFSFRYNESVKRQKWIWCSFFVAIQKQINEEKFQNLLLYLPRCYLRYSK